MGIGVGVVLDQAKGPGPGERRFIKAVGDDPRFELRLIAGVPAQAPTGPELVDKVLRVEARVFPAPDSAPVDIPEIAALPDDLPEDCHVIVDFSNSDAVLARAGRVRGGVWRLSAYAPDAGLVEARDRAPYTEVTLFKHLSGQPPKPISSARYDTKFLASRNAALIREKSVQLALQALSELALTGSDSAAGAPQSETPPAKDPFTPGDLPGYGLRTVSELATRTLNALGERIGRRPGMFELRVGHGDALTFDPASGVTLTPPAGTYWADPFLLEHGGALYLFYEVFDYATRLGHLDVGRIDGDRLTPLGTALKLPYHLSYPHVFHWDGEIWMIPETHAAKHLELWRATDFPTGWDRVKTAFDGISMADTVVFERDGQWWLFTNICRDSFNDHGAELHLFRIDSPMMNVIEPHPLNPVVIDTTTARGGGRVFEKGNKLYRTSQDNSHGLYGFGLNVMEITRLDMEGYGEQRTRHVTGDFDEGIMACHHMDAVAGRFVIDVRRRVLGAPK